MVYILKLEKIEEITENKIYEPVRVIIFIQIKANFIKTVH